MSLGTLGKRLRSSSNVFQPSVAAAIRNRLASLLASEPSRAYELSTDYVNALGRTPDSIPPVTRSIVWRCRAEAAFLTGRLPEAQEAYERAAAEARAAKDDGLLGEILVGQIGLLGLLGETDETAKLARQAERLLRRSRNTPYLAKLHMNVGNVFYHQERYQKAFDAYGRSRALFERAAGRDATWVGLLVNQAIACTHLSRVADARRLFLQAEEHTRDLGLDHLHAQAVFNRAELERLRGDYRAALSMLEDAGDIFEREGARDLAASAVRSRSEIYRELGMPGEARELARKATEAFSIEGMALDAAISRVDEARALLLLDRPDDSVPILEEASAHFASQRIRPRGAVAAQMLARAFYGQGRYGAARTTARRTLRTFETLNMALAASETRRLLAEIALAEGSPARSERYLAPALENARSHPSLERVALWSLAGRIAIARGQRSSATTKLRRAVRHLETHRRLVPGIDLRSRAFGQHVAVYRDLLQLLIEAPRVRFGTVYGLVEAARGRGFRERLRRGGTRASESVRESRAHLGSLVRQLEEAEFEERPDSTRLDKLRRRIKQVEGETEALVRRAEAKESGAGRWTGHDPGVVCEHLRSGEVLVEYFLLKDALLVLVLDRERQRFRRIPCDLGHLRQVLADLNFQLTTMAATASGVTGNADFLRRVTDHDLQRLHAALIEPVQDLLPDTGRLILVPHDFLHHVPFECLKDDGGYLSERWIITRSPTADFLLRRRRRSRRRGRSPDQALVAGVVAGGPHSVEREVKSVVSAFPGGEARMLWDPTAPEFLEAIGDAAFVHLVTHGVFRDDNPAFSRLSMKDGTLFMADVLDVDLSAARLVGLSACNSGHVFAGGGDDLLGVAHAFLAAGAQTLLASQWRVHDEATTDLMSVFYRRLMGEASGDPGVALRQAAREIRDRWDHPFYWGGFTLHGE